MTNFPPISHFLRISHINERKNNENPKLQKVQKLETNREFFEFRTKSRNEKWRLSDAGPTWPRRRDKCVKVAAKIDGAWAIVRFFRSVLFFLNVPFFHFSVQNRIDRKKPVKAELIAVSCVCVCSCFFIPHSCLRALSFHPLSLVFFCFFRK